MRSSSKSNSTSRNYDDKSNHGNSNLKVVENERNDRPYKRQNTNNTPINIRESNSNSSVVSSRPERSGIGVDVDEWEVLRKMISRCRVLVTLLS